MENEHLKTLEDHLVQYLEAPDQRALIAYTLSSAFSIGYFERLGVEIKRDIDKIDAKIDAIKNIK